MDTRTAHALSAREVARRLESDADFGLTQTEAATRLARYGANRPRRPRGPPYVRLFLNEPIDPLVLLLVAAAAVSIAIGDGIEESALTGESPPVAQRDRALPVDTPPAAEAGGMTVIRESR